MPGNRDPETLTTSELRRLLMEKQLEAHKKRLDAYRRSGRVLRLDQAPAGPTSDEWQPRYSHEELIDTQIGKQAESKPHQFLDKVLLAVELIAAGALVFVLFNGMALLKQLNQEVVQVIQQPTLTATPLINAVVLPSGHTPPNSPGGAQPNENEIPEHLRPLVQSIAAVPVPTQGPEQAVRIQIPAINVDAPVVQGDGWEQLKKGVGQHIGSANPGANGNLILSAHNDIYGEIFRPLDRIKPGDKVIIYTSQRQVTYVVTNTEIVSPTAVDVLAGTGNPTLTLISCYPYMVDNQRIVVRATLEK